MATFPMARKNNPCASMFPAARKENDQRRPEGHERGQHGQHAAHAADQVIDPEVVGPREVGLGHQEDQDGIHE